MVVVRQVGVNDESSMFCPDKSRPTNENGESFVETVGAASGNTLNEIVEKLLVGIIHW